MPEETAVVEGTPSPTSDALASMTFEQRQNWKMTGQLPEPSASPAEVPAKEPTEESAPSPEPSETPAVEPEPAPAPEPGTTQETKPEVKLTGAEKRIKQLLARNKELQAQLEARSAPTVAPKAEEKPAPAAAATAPPMPRIDDLNPDGSAKYPNEQDYFTAYHAWNEARTQERIDAALKADREAQSKAQKDAEVAKQNQAIETEWKRRVADATKRHADFHDVALDKEFLNSIPKGSVLDAFVLDSEQGAEVLYHLATHIEDFERILPLPPLAQARELFKLEMSLAPTPNSPAPKVTTSAPPPPAELAARGTPPADEVVWALQRGDFTAYRNAANAKELAKARKG